MDKEFASNKEKVHKNFIKLIHYYVYNMYIPTEKEVEVLLKEK